MLFGGDSFRDYHHNTNPRAPQGARGLLALEIPEAVKLTQKAAGPQELGPATEAKPATLEHRL